MDTNDWIRLFTESRQQMADALTPLGDSPAAAMLNSLLQDVASAQEKLFRDTKQTEDTMKHTPEPDAGD